jgi:hypothetical protein
MNTEFLIMELGCLLVGIVYSVRYDDMGVKPGRGRNFSVFQDGCTHLHVQWAPGFLPGGKVARV